MAALHNCTGLELHGTVVRMPGTDQDRVIAANLKARSSRSLASRRSITVRRPFASQQSALGHTNAPGSRGRENVEP